jgi:hypothetical protein
MLNNKQPLLRVQQSQFSLLMTVGSDFNPFARRLIILYPLMLDYIISHDYPRPADSYVLQTPGSDENNADGVIRVYVFYSKMLNKTPTLWYFTVRR